MRPEDKMDVLGSEHALVARVRGCLRAFATEQHPVDPDLVIEVLTLTTCWLSCQPPGSPNGEALGQLLRPVVAKSPEAGEAWGRLWELQVAGMERSRDAVEEPDDGAAVRRAARGQEKAKADAGSSTRSTIRLATAIVVVVLLLFAFALSQARTIFEFLAGPGWVRTNMERFVQLYERLPLPEIDSTVALLALAGIAWLAAGLLVLRILRRASATGDSPSFAHSGLLARAGQESEGLWAETFQNVARELRRLGGLKRPTHRQRLDVDATVVASAERLGVFSPIHKAIFETPHYVFVVAMKDYRDHALGEAARLTTAFKRTGLASEVFFWRPTSGLVIPERGLTDPDITPRPLDFSQLWSRHPDSTLIMIASASDLVDPMTLRSRASLGLLENWDHRILLSQLPTVDPIEGLAIEDLGLMASTLSLSDIPALVATIARAKDGHRPPLPRASAPAPAALAASALASWDDGDQGDGNWAVLEAALIGWLDRDGLNWLAATAALPFLAWELTVPLGWAVTNDRDEPVYEDQRARRLMSLSWFETGRLPRSIRERLLAILPDKQARQVKSLFRTLGKAGGTDPARSTINPAVEGRPAACFDPAFLPSADDRTSRAFFGGGQGRSAVDFGRLLQLLTVFLGALAAIFLGRRAPSAPDARSADTVDDHPIEPWGVWARRRVEMLGWSVLGGLGAGPARVSAAIDQTLKTFFFSGAGVGEWTARRAIEGAFEDFTTSRHLATPQVLSTAKLLDEISAAVRRWKGTRAVRGAYILGGPGWGKSAMLRSLIVSRPIQQIGLLAFPNLMAGLSELASTRTAKGTLRGSRAYLAVRTRYAAKWVARNIKLLCIDDMGRMSALEAFVLLRFLAALRKNGVTLVYASRLAPDALAPGRAGRELAEFIDATTILASLSPLELGDGLGTRKDREHAILRDLRRHEQVYGKDTSAVAKAYLEMAEIRSDQQEYEQAEAYLTRAIAIEEHDGERDLLLPLWLLRLSGLLEAQGRVDSAAEVCQRALREVENIHDPHNDIGNLTDPRKRIHQLILKKAATLQIQRGDFSRAANFLEAAIQIQWDRMNFDVLVDPGEIEIEEDMEILTDLFGALGHSQDLGQIQADLPAVRRKLADVRLRQLT